MLTGRHEMPERAGVVRHQEIATTKPRGAPVQAREEQGNLGCAAIWHPRIQVTAIAAWL